MIQGLISMPRDLVITMNIQLNLHLKLAIAVGYIHQVMYDLDIFKYGKHFDPKNASIYHLICLRDCRNMHFDLSTITFSV